MNAILWAAAYAVGVSATLAVCVVTRMAIGLAGGAAAVATFGSGAPEGEVSVLLATPFSRVVAVPLFLVGVLVGLGGIAWSLFTLGSFAYGLGWGALILLVSPLAWLYFALLISVTRLAAVLANLCWFVGFRGLGRLRGPVVALVATLVLIGVLVACDPWLFPVGTKDNTVFVRMTLPIFGD